MSHVHGPILRTPDSKPGADKDQLYRDNVEYLDKLVGKLMAELDRLHLREKTLVIFTGDNGRSYARNGRFKLNNGGELFDLSEAPYKEQHRLSSRHRSSQSPGGRNAASRGRCRGRSCL